MSSANWQTEPEELLRRVREAERAYQELREENEVNFELPGVGRGDIYTENGRIVRVNKALCEITGYTQEELLGLTIHHITHPDDRPIFGRQYTRMLAGEIESYAVEKRYLRKDGCAVWVAINASLLPERPGRPAMMTSVVRDITALKMAEAAAQESATKFRGVFENSFDAIAVYKGDAHAMANQAYLRLFRYESFEELAKVTGPELIASSHRAMVRDRIERRLRGEPVPADYVSRGVRKDGTEFDLEIHASLFHVDRDVYRLVILRDVSERVRAHEELETRVAERTADLSLANERLQNESSKRRRMELAMWDAIDREQRRIGEDLHDSLGQQLAGIGCKLKAIRAPEAPGLMTELERVARLLREAIVQTREIAHGLYPQELEEGIFFALGYLSEKMTDSYGVECSFAAGEIFPVREICARHLYRIAQEAISNSLKHGRATRIRIELRRARGLVRLSIGDNGIGFSVAGPRPGMGLKTMRNRARIIGGGVSIKRNPDGGTCVTCSFRPDKIGLP
ncbi:MAG TPA: PAS domain S-box protein [Chthoniobacteraceae bacterium]|jgi:hypothetical protein|nr:PAS domain S-box protein [Chthoniobacteraceae bacterium]